MDFRKFLTGKNLLISIVLVALVFSTAGYFLFRKPPRVPMEPYVPASALAYLEINSLTDLMDGLTDTKAWQEIAPVLGLSSQLKQLGSGIDLMSRTGIGPDEIVTLGRAQYAIVVTGIEAKATSTEEGAALNIKPQFALIAETHASPETAAKLVSDRAAILAKRIFGEATREETADYQGTSVLIFRGEPEGRQLVATSSGSVVILANHEAAAKVCLDAIARRTATLAEDELLKQRRSEVDADAGIFAYVTNAGIEKLTQVGPALFATRFTNDPDKLSMVANLFGNMSKQTAEAFFYSLTFNDKEGVTEKYFTLLRPQLARGLAETMRPANNGNDFAVLALIPQNAQECTVLKVESAGALPENLLKGLSPGLDIVAGLALREFVIGFRKELGLEPGETLNNSIGSEVAIVKTQEDEPVALVFRVKDRNALSAAVNKYLTQDKATITKENYNGVEIQISSKADGSSAAFVGEYLILATRNQIAGMIDAQANGRSIEKDEQVKSAFANAPRFASVLSFEDDSLKTAKMLLAISKLTRVTDGAPEILERGEVRASLERLPKLQSYTVFRDAGVYAETRSAIGVFKRLGEWLE
ncbi:MAG: DUF3352 domain-containing protein [Acidobacteriota bacterium]